MDGTPLSYDSFNLQDDNFITAEIGDSVPFDRNLGVNSRVRRPGAIITNDTYGTKLIPVSGKIEAESDTALELLIDNFELAMSSKLKRLDIGYGGGTRRYIATPTAVHVDRPVRAGNWANFSMGFLITEFGRGIATNTILNEAGATVNNQDYEIDPIGSAPQQFLIFTVNLNSFTGAAFNTITLSNSETGQAISISRTFTAGEEIKVDVEDQSVKIDGEKVDFSGAFPIFAPGNNRLINYSDGFTARDYDLVVTQVPRYL